MPGDENRPADAADRIAVRQDVPPSEVSPGARTDERTASLITQADSHRRPDSPESKEHRRQLTVDFSGTERFEIIRRIGQGGMGVVYEALDRERRMRVALKTLREMDDSALYLFKQEFRSLIDVVHPNLVTLYELIAAGDTWFFTMELIRGYSFLDFIRHEANDEPGQSTSEVRPSFQETFRPWALETLPTSLLDRPDSFIRVEPRVLSPARIPSLRNAFRQLVNGAGALHDAGKVHCDVKPSNVLVADGARVVLLDFGLVAQRSQVPNERNVLHKGRGTPRYMAPEQIRGEPLTPASDWYAVGATLYEVLTGRPPFVGEESEVQQRKLTSDPPSPRTLAPEIPADLDRLCMQLLQRDPAERPDCSEILAALGTKGRTPEFEGSAHVNTRHESALVGRDAQLRALEDAFARVRSGRTTAVLAHGPSGVGKSALLSHFVGELAAHEEVVVLAGRCYPDEAVPYKAFDSLIDGLWQHLCGLSEDELRATVPANIWPLARVFPVLRRFAAVADGTTLSAGPAGPSVLPPQQTRRPAFAALRELLAALGRRRPLVLLVDDMQWGDEDSIGLLAEILRPPTAPRLLFLGAYRSEFADSSPILASLREALSFVPGTPSWHDLPVEPLTAQAAAELAESLLAPSELANTDCIRRVVTEAGGSPYFVHELARACVASSGDLLTRSREGASLTLDEILWKRVRELPAPERQLLEVVAVSGRPLPLGVAYGAAFFSGAAQPAMPGLRVSNLLRATGTGPHVDVDTYHDRVRETILARLPPEELRALHGRLARTLESSGVDDPEALGVHFHGAGDLARAGDYYARAGEVAAGALAFDQASRLFRLSLELRKVPPTEERRLRLQLAQALANAGRGSQAAREYEVASVGASPNEALELKRRAAFQYCVSGNLDEGRAAFGKVLGGVGMRLPTTPTRALFSVLASRARLWLRGLAFRERDTEEVPPATLTRIDITHSVSFGLTTVDPITGADFQTRSLLFALDAGEPSRVALALAWEAAVSSLKGGRGAKRTARLLADARALAGRTGEPHALGMVALCTGITAFLEGRFRTCTERSDEALTLLRSVAGAPFEQHLAEIYGCWGRLLSGELLELRQRIDHLPAEAEDRGDLYTLIHLITQCGAMVRLADDNPDGARAAIHTVIDRWTRERFTIQHLAGQYGEFYCDLYTGDSERAWKRVGDVWPKFRRSMQNQAEYLRIYLGHLSACAALARAEDVRDSKPLLRAAARHAAALRRERGAWAAPLASVIEAGLAGHRGDREAQRALLEAALRDFDADGLVLYAASARDRLGSLVMGDEGRALRTAAAASMAAQGVRNPEYMTRIFAPAARA